MFPLNSMNNLILSAIHITFHTVIKRSALTKPKSKKKQFLKPFYCLFSLHQSSSDLKSCDSSEIWSICFWFIYGLTNDCKKWLRNDKVQYKVSASSLLTVRRQMALVKDFVKWLRGFSGCFCFLLNSQWLLLSFSPPPPPPPPPPLFHLFLVRIH